MAAFPKVGDLVHFTINTTDGPQTQGLVVTFVDGEGRVSVGHKRHRIAEIEPYADDVPFAEVPTPGHWSWPKILTRVWVVPDENNDTHSVHLSKATADAESARLAEAFKAAHPVQPEDAGAEVVEHFIPKEYIVTE